MIVVCFCYVPIIFMWQNYHFPIVIAIVVVIIIMKGSIICHYQFLSVSYPCLTPDRQLKCISSLIFPRRLSVEQNFHKSPRFYRQPTIRLRLSWQCGVYLENPCFKEAQSDLCVFRAAQLWSKLYWLFRNKGWAGRRQPTAESILCLQSWTHWHIFQR